MKTKSFLLITLFVTLSIQVTQARTKFDVEYLEKNKTKTSRIRSSVVTNNVLQLAHPDLKTYLRVESTEQENGNYQLQIYIKDLKSGEVIARPQIIAKPGELAQIEVSNQYRVSLRASPN